MRLLSGSKNAYYFFQFFSKGDTCIRRAGRAMGNGVTAAVARNCGSKAAAESQHGSGRSAKLPPSSLRTAPHSLLDSDDHAGDHLYAGVIDEASSSSSSASIGAGGFGYVAGAGSSLAVRRVASGAFASVPASDPVAP